LPLDGTAIYGNVALLQSTNGKQGNFELIVPRSDTGFDYYWHDNDNIKKVWYRPFPAAVDLGRVDSVSLIQRNNFGTGNLYMIAVSSDHRTELDHLNIGDPSDWKKGEVLNQSR
jgi:hypothetical protein